MARTLGAQHTLTAADLMLPVAELSSPHPTTIAEPIAGLSAIGIGAGWVAGRDDGMRIDDRGTAGALLGALQSDGQGEWSSLKAAELITSDAITVGAATFAIKVLTGIESNRCGAASVLPLGDAQSRVVGLLRLHDPVQAGHGR